MIFGAGTELFVEPQSQPLTEPSVFIMKNGTSVACLVKDFYPKNVAISLQSSKRIVEFDPAIVVSPSGKYSAVKLGQYEDSNSVTCSVQHNNKILYSTDFEPNTTSSDDLKQMEPEDIQQTSKSCHDPKVHPGKVNMMSLTVLGLRMLFAKSVAINFLLTVKLVFFEDITDPDPAVYQLRNPKSNISVCLFTDFDSETNVSQKTGPTVFSTDKTALDMRATGSKSNGALLWSNSNDFECQGAFNETFYSSSDMNLNFQNLSVFGYRILLLKVVGFNLLMTLRLWSS
ncbi:T-cell receptor alpha chain C region [Pteropus alecto]|nr:T-cell receptor alpha chain C region [Pteropus alecto]